MPKTSPSPDLPQAELFDLSGFTAPKKSSSAPRKSVPRQAASNKKLKPVVPQPVNALQASLRRRPVRVLQGVADPVRYKVLRLLSEGAIMSVKALAKTLDAHPDTMGKHVKVLRTRGIVVSVKPEKSDGRMQLVQIPEEFRVTDASGRPMLDFGVCVVRFE